MSPEQRRYQELVALRRKVDRELARLEKLARKRPATRAKVAACGTDAGYSRHRKRAEDACDACKRAHSDYEKARAYRASRRAFHEGNVA